MEGQADVEAPATRERIPVDDVSRYWAEGIPDSVEGRCGEDAGGHVSSVGVSSGLGWPSDTGTVGAEQRTRIVGEPVALGWPSESPAENATETEPEAVSEPAAGRAVEKLVEKIVDDAVSEVSRETSSEHSDAASGVSTESASEGQLDVSDKDEPAAEQEPATGIPAAVSTTRRLIRPKGSPWPRPPHTRVVTIANQKGGVGKTTTAVNLAASLSLGGQRVLVIDTDPQGNASTALGIDHTAEVDSIYDVLVEDVPLGDVVQECALIPGLYCVPATIELAGAEIELVSFVARETRLQRAIQAYLDDLDRRGEHLDYVIIDCPPSLGLLTINAFVAGEEVLIPIQCEYYALEGLSMLIRNIDMIRRHLNPRLHISTILLTMYDARTRLSQQVAEEVRNHFSGQVLKAMVPRSVRVSEAPSHGETVLTYDPMSTGSLAYLDAAKEFAARGVAQD